MCWVKVHHDCFLLLSLTWQMFFYVFIKIFLTHQLSMYFKGKVQAVKSHLKNLRHFRYSKRIKNNINTMKQFHNLKETKLR